MTNALPSTKTTAIIALLATIVLGACGGNSDDLPITVDASIDGTNLADAGSGSPLPLDTSESELSLSMTNDGDRPVAVKYARIEGEVLSLTFLTYTTRLQVELAPGEQRDIVLPLEFFDIDSQAHGFLRSNLRLYAGDENRTQLSNTTFAVDVRGKVTSTMALFAVLLVILTGYTIALNAMGLMRRTLPSNRFRRGVRFGVSGLGIGLIVAVGFSVLRIFPLPGAASWPLIVIPTVIAVAFGYVAPGADDEIDEEDLEAFLDEQEELDEIDLSDATG